MTNPTLAPYAKEGEMELRVTAKAAAEEEAQTLLIPVVENLQERFSDFIYGIDVENLESVVLTELKRTGKTLCTAESCTGGLIAKRITDLPGASAVFYGGVVSYVNEVKAGVLGVPSQLLEEYGAVSEQVARAMAEGARKALGSDLAVAVTGVAGPDKDDRGNEVGTVFVALTDGEQTWVRRPHLGGVRGRIRTTAANHALDMVRRYLQKKL